jgi:hypothetical protein
VHGAAVEHGQEAAHADRPEGVELDWVIQQDEERQKRSGR